MATSALEQAAVPGPWGVAAIYTVRFALCVVVAVRLHRLVLTRQVPSSSFSVLKFDQTDLVYMAWLFAVAAMVPILASLIAMPEHHSLEWFLIEGLIPLLCFVVLCRQFAVLLAIALGGPSDWQNFRAMRSRAAMASKPAFWPVILAISVVIFALALALTGLSLVPWNLTVQEAEAINIVIGNLMILAFISMEAAIMSAAYLRLPLCDTGLPRPTPRDIDPP